MEHSVVEKFRRENGINKKMVSLDDQHDGVEERLARGDHGDVETKGIGRIGTKDEQGRINLLPVRRFILTTATPLELEHSPTTVEQ